MGSSLRNVSRCVVTIAGWALFVDLTLGQDPPRPLDLATRAKQLEELVREAELLLKQDSLDGARAACRRALVAANLEGASEDWLALVEESLWRLGSASYHSGDLQCAHDAWRAVHDHRARLVPDDHVGLQTARINLAATKLMLGDVRGAVALQEKVLAVLSKTLPDDDPRLQVARQQLAASKYTLGDLPAALELQQQVFAVRVKRLPDDHPELQDARQNLAAIKKDLGDLHGALVLEERILEVRSATLADGHPALQNARNNLAVTKERLGDLPSALALQEKVVAAYSEALPDDHPALQVARVNLAAFKSRLGDLQGAVALQEKVLAVRSRTLPDDHTDLQVARLNLASSRRRLGDASGALALEQKVLAVRSETLPEDHVDLQRCRLSLAMTLYEMNDLPGALALQEQVLAVWSKLLPESDDDLQVARGTLALTKAALGDWAGARALQQKVLTVAQDEHTDPSRVQLARLYLSHTLRNLGDLPAAARLQQDAASNALSRLSNAIVSTRDATQLAIAAAMSLSHIGSLLDTNAGANAEAALAADVVASLTTESLSLLTAIRSSESHTTELLRDVVAKNPSAFAELNRAIAKASKDLENAIALPTEGLEDASGKQVRRDDAIREAVLAKDAAERAINDKVPAELRATPTAKALATGLAKDEAGVAFLTYTRWTCDREKPGITAAEPRFAAFVLTPSGRVTWHSLAPVADVEDQIAEIRRDAATGIRVRTRSTANATDAPPGRDGEETTPKPDTLSPRLVALRDLLLEPVLAALPAGTSRIVLSPADEMLLAPIEDLPLADGRPFAEAFDVQTVPSLRVLMRTPKTRSAEPTTLVMGGIDYDATPADPAEVVPDTTTPILEPVGNTALANAEATTRSGNEPTAHRFRTLPGTAAEVEQLGRLSAAAFANDTPIVLRSTDASELAFTERAPGKSFLHIATHGYFAPETVWSAPGTRSDSPLGRFDVGQRDRVGQLSPFSLTGIALAGANLPPDELGRREGILTAQEIARLDLTACHLATLSACNTTLGVRRGGTGLASLRQAFHAAGARFVLATLWEVDDAEAQTLMADFYTRLWKNGEEPRAALRAAKKAARERGAPFRDQAGWMITGR